MRYDYKRHLVQSSISIKECLSKLNELSFDAILFVVNSNGSAISSDRKIFSIDKFEIPKNWSKSSSDNWIFKNYSQIEWATKNRNALGFESKITFVESDSKSYAADLRNMPNRPKFDLIFIDGDHSYEGCLSDLKDYMPMLEEGGYLVMHDYNSPLHPGVAKAVAEVIQSDISFKCLYIVQSLIVIIKEYPKS